MKFVFFGIFFENLECVGILNVSLFVLQSYETVGSGICVCIRSTTLCWCFWSVGTKLLEFVILCTWSYCGIEPKSGIICDEIVYLLIECVCYL